MCSDAEAPGGRRTAAGSRENLQALTGRSEGVLFDNWALGAKASRWITGLRRTKVTKGGEELDGKNSAIRSEGHLICDQHGLLVSRV